MEFRALGDTELEVSVFTLGSWMTYETVSEDQALAVIGRGIDAGINFFDDARYDDYTGEAPMETGYSEVLFGRLLHLGGWNRDDLVIANKLWYEFYPDEGPEEELDGSLFRLKMDYVDLVYCAPPSDAVSVAELVRQMEGLIQTGKARHWGLMLDWSTEEMEEAYEMASREGMAVPCAIQMAYSLLNPSRAEDEATQAACREAGLGIVSARSLYGGLLTGKYNRGRGAMEGRFDEAEIEAMREEGLLEKIDRVIELAEALDATPAQVALAYCLKHDQVATILFGATKPSQIEENVGALEILPRMDADVMAELRDLAE